MTCQHHRMVMGGTNENSLYCVECKMTYSGQDIVSLGALLWSGDLDSKTVSQVRGMADDFRSKLEKERDTLQAKLDVAEKESHERELTILGNGHVLKHKQGLADAAEKERDAMQNRHDYLLDLSSERGVENSKLKDSLKAAAQRVEQLAKENAELRPEVLAFAHLMETQLRANDHKAGWKDDDPDSLMKRLDEELWELKHTQYVFADKIGKEAADVANFAMMVADVCGALASPAPREEREVASE